MNNRAAGAFLILNGIVLLCIIPLGVIFPDVFVLIPAVNCITWVTSVWGCVSVLAGVWKYRQK